ncbi:MAG: hypothetical protein KGL63_09675 [Betaproteobacteria bacterium]|nr:hypothetical protein [Betaproteobacteria bacterium]
MMFTKRWYKAGGMPRCTSSATVTLCLLFAGNCIAAQAPSHTDLKAAFCLSVFNEEQSVMEQSMAMLRSTRPDLLTGQPGSMLQKTENDIRAKIDRLKAYLSPRLAYLDPRPMSQATDSGKTALQNVAKNPKLYQCVASCKGYAAQSSELLQCIKNCGSQDESATRLQQCQDLSFLPY